MKKIILFSVMVLFVVSFFAEGEISLSTNYVDVQGDKNNFLEQNGTTDSLNIDLFNLKKFTGRKPYFQLESFVRGNGDLYSDFKYGEEDKYKLNVKLVRNVYFDDTSSSNFSPLPTSTYSQKRIFFSLPGSLIRKSLMLNSGYKYHFENGSLLEFKVNILNHKGGIATLSGGSFGSAIDFSYPAKKDRNSNIRDFSANLTFPFRKIEFYFLVDGTNYDTTDISQKRQFGGISLNRTIIDNNTNNNKGLSVQGGVKIPIFSEKSFLNIGFYTSKNENKPYFSEIIADKLYPSAYGLVNDSEIKAKYSSVYGNMVFYPSERLTIILNSSVDDEDVDSSTSIFESAYIPIEGIFLKERINTTTSDISLLASYPYGVSLNLNLGYSYRNYEKKLEEEILNEYLKRSYYKFYISKAVGKSKIKMAIKRNERDTDGDFGERNRVEDSYTLSYTFKPAKRVNISSKVEMKEIHNQESYDLTTNSKNSMFLKNYILEGNYRAKKNFSLFFSGRYSKWESNYDFLKKLDYFSQFIPVNYNLIERNSQIGFLFYPNSKFSYGGSLGRILISGSQNYKDDFISGLFEYSLKNGFSLSGKLFYTRFSKALYQYDNFTGNTFILTLTKRF